MDPDLPNAKSCYPSKLCGIIIITMGPRSMLADANRPPTFKHASDSIDSLPEDGGQNMTAIISIVTSGSV